MSDARRRVALVLTGGTMNSVGNYRLDLACCTELNVVNAVRVGSARVVYAPAVQRRGFVAAGDLQPWTARIQLQLALTRTTNAPTMQQMFERY